MNPTRTRPDWKALLLLALGLTALYSGALMAGFLNDDHLFLEEARLHSLAEAWSHPQGLANYFRPLSRQVWFALLTPIADGRPVVFHVADLLVFLAALALLGDLLLAVAPPAAALAGLLWFALLPLQRVNLTWISCSQDLLALAGTLGAFALHRRGRTRPAVLAYLAAILCKEAALPLPALLFAWGLWADGQKPNAALRRVLPYAVPLALWAMGEYSLRRSSPGIAAPLHFGLPEFGANLLHLGQAVLGIEHPAGLIDGLLTAGPPVLALALLAPLAAWFPATAPSPTPATIAPRNAVRFALAWLLGFALIAWPLAATWSAYYFTLAAVGGAVLVALAARRLTRWPFVALLMLALWWHAGISAIPAFAVQESPWNTTSRLTAYYFERAASLSARLTRALRRVEPIPASGTRFFFATLPPFAGFQMGNGAAIRSVYHDPSLESYFYSEFSESTAAQHPCVFLFWDGVDFTRLYAQSGNPFFQVGTDLLLLQRPLGAMHAFRRGLAAGEDRSDHLYWLGWAALASERRDLAEQAWTQWGAHDDPLVYGASLRAARTALDMGDTLSARRRLVDAVRAGIGRPEAHAALGELLKDRNRKYALLETQVTTELHPLDWLARRDLVEGLVDARLDGPARTELQTLRRIHPSWAADTLAARLERILRERTPDARPVVTFTPIR